MVLWVDIDRSLIDCVPTGKEPGKFRYRIGGGAPTLPNSTRNVYVGAVRLQVHECRDLITRVYVLVEGARDAVVPCGPLQFESEIEIPSGQGR